MVYVTPFNWVFISSRCFLKKITLFNVLVETDNIMDFNYKIICLIIILGLTKIRRFHFCLKFLGMQFDWDNLERNTMRQLKAEADALSIFIPHRSTKTDIIRILESQRSNLETPLERPLLSKGNYIENYSPPEKIDIHQSALDSMKRNYLPSVPKDIIADVIVNSKSPYQKDIHFSPSIGSPTLVSLSSPILKSPSIADRFVPTMLNEESTGSNSAIMSADSSRAQSPLIFTQPKTTLSTSKERIMSPLVTNERSITPIHVPQTRGNGNYNISGITKLFYHSSWILAIVTFLASFFVGEAIFATPLFMLLFLLFYIIRSIEINSKARKLIQASYNVPDPALLQITFKPDKAILRKAVTLMQRK